jgi:mRNA interferase RelE/StbE
MDTYNLRFRVIEAPCSKLQGMGSLLQFNLVKDVPKVFQKKMIQALRELEDAKQPLSHPIVRPLTGKLQGDYRLRVGKWRILFTPDKEKRMIYVYAILPRGDAY